MRGGQQTVAYLREHCPTVKVLVLTAYDDKAYVRGRPPAGVAGYVLKDEATEAVLDALHTVVGGGTWFSRPVVEKLARLEKEDPGLTSREWQILELMARGWDNARIATELSLAEQTVRNYVSRIYTRLNMSSRAEVVVWAREGGLGGKEWPRVLEEDVWLAYKRGAYDRIVHEYYKREYTCIYTRRARYGILDAVEPLGPRRRGDNRMIRSKEVIVNRYVRLTIVAALIVLLATLSPNVVLANGKGGSCPDVGPPVAGLTPGKGGYKVFGPSAIKCRPIHLASPNNGAEWDTFGTGLYRRGATDVFQDGPDNVRGSHTSQSDLFEDEIWIDGAIKREGQGWYDSCSNHSSGQFAHCSTSMPDPNLTQTFIAHSWHHFHTTGYVDNNFETEDRIDT